jgi:hypothetical protein
VTATLRDSRALGSHERRYVRTIERHLRDVPFAQRTALLREVEAHLGDRPTTHDDDELVRALGAPAEYAATLRGEHGLGAERREWAVRWSARAPRQKVLIVAAILLAIALAIGGVATYRWWVDWQADIAAPGFGVHFSDGRDSGITERSTFDSSQVDVTYDSNRQVELWLQMIASPSVRVTGIELSQAPVSLLRPRRVETAPMSTGAPWTTFRPFDLDQGIDVRMTFAFRDCQSFASGDSVVFDHVTVRYHARGRDRSEDVRLGSLLSIVSPPDARCPARHRP